MNEILRQEYLNSMGIQSYFPRYVLPAAKQSEQCAWPESKKAEKKSIAELKNSIEKEAVPAPVAEPEAVEPVKQSNKAKEIDEVRFHLAIIHVNDDLLALVLLPYMNANGSLNAVQKQLFSNIFSTLYQGPVNLNLEIKPFHWPFSEAPHIEKDASAAKASLAAYLEQLKGKFSFTSIVLMGDKIAPLIDAGEGYELTVCRSLDEMLKMPQLKREVWQQLNASLKSS